MRVLFAIAACLAASCSQPAPDPQRARLEQAREEGERAQASPRSNWNERAQLLALLPLIDACMALSSATPLVMFDQHLAGEIAEFRLFGSGQSIDCVFPHDAVVPENAVLTARGESRAFNNPVYFVRLTNANQACGAQEVRSDDGELVGWLTGPEGC